MPRITSHGMLQKMALQGKAGIHSKTFITTLNQYMQTATFQRSKILLSCAIATAGYFTTVIFLDYLRIENNVIAAAREMFLIPFFLMLIILPFMLFRDLVKKKYDQRILLYAAIAWASTLLLVIAKTFFLS